MRLGLGLGLDRMSNGGGEPSPGDVILSHGPRQAVGSWWKDSWLNAAAAPVSGSDPIATLLDQSGNGHHYTQATGSMRPIRETGPNGLSVANWDGISHNMRTELALTGSATFFVVVQPDLTVGSPGYQRLLTVCGVGQYDFASPSLSVLLRRSDAAIASYQDMTLTEISTPNAWQIISVRYTVGSGVRMKIGNTVANYNTAVANLTTSQAVINAEYPGTSNGLKHKGTGYLIFDRSLSDDEMTSVEGALQTIHGL